MQFPLPDSNLRKSRSSFLEKKERTKMNPLKKLEMKNKNLSTKLLKLSKQ